MVAIKNVFFLVCGIMMLWSCAPLRQPVVVKNASIKDFKYVYISPTKEITSNVAGVYGGAYGVYGSSTTAGVNPSDVIAGILMKEGFVVLSEFNAEVCNETLIVNYGESGRRERGWGYTIEVTIQFISAETKQMICTSTAEGQGSTEVDDVRIAIGRALDALFTENN